MDDISYWCYHLNHKLIFSKELKRLLVLLVILSLVMHSFNFNDSQSKMYWLCYEMLLPNSSKLEKSMIYDKQSKTPCRAYHWTGFRCKSKEWEWLTITAYFLRKLSSIHYSLLNLLYSQISIISLLNKNV